MKTLKKLLASLAVVCCISNLNASNIHHKVVFDTNISISTKVAKDGSTYSIIKQNDCVFSSEEGMPR